VNRGFVKLIAVGACAAAMLVAPMAHASHSETGEYTIGSTPVVGFVCSPDCLGLAGVNLGGYIFEGVAGEIPVSVTIADSSGGIVGFTASQDLNGDGLFGDAGEPGKAGCGTTMSLTTGSQVPFQANRPTLVGVRVVDPTCPGGLGLGGTATLTWGAPA
jgi:hypothetical protein